MMAAKQMLLQHSGLQLISLNSESRATFDRLPASPAPQLSVQLSYPTVSFPLLLGTATLWLRYIPGRHTTEQESLALVSTASFESQQIPAVPPTSTAFRYRKDCEPPTREDQGRGLLPCREPCQTQIRERGRWGEEEWGGILKQRLKNGHVQN